MAIPVGMILNAGQFFTKYWKEILLVLLLAGFALYWRSLYVKIETLETNYTNLQVKFKTETNTYKLNKDTYEASIKTQNKSISDLNEQLKDANKEFTDYKEKATTAAKKYKEELDRIRKEPRPKTCEASIIYLIDGAGELIW